MIAKDGVYMGLSFTSSLEGTFTGIDCSIEAGEVAQAESGGRRRRRAVDEEGIGRASLTQAIDCRGLGLSFTSLLLPD